MKNGHIYGFGSMPSYAGREYISVTRLMGLTMRLFFSETGTCGYSSGAGSDVSQAQSKSFRRASSLGSSSSGHQPSSATMLSVPDNRSVASAFAVRAAMRSQERRSEGSLSPCARISSSSASRSCVRAASSPFRRSMFSFAVPCMPGKLTCVQPMARIASDTAESSLLSAITAKQCCCSSSDTSTS